MKIVHVKVISKAPPGGRCQIYDRLFFEIVKGCENVTYSLIPENLWEGKACPPTVIVEDEKVEPADGVLLTPDEIISSLEKKGAIFRENREALSKKLKSITEKLIGG